VVIINTLPFPAQPRSRDNWRVIKFWVTVGIFMVLKMQFKLLFNY